MQTKSCVRVVITDNSSITHQTWLALHNERINFRKGLNRKGLITESALKHVAQQDI